MSGGGKETKKTLVLATNTLDNPFLCCFRVYRRRVLSGPRSWHALFYCTGFQRNCMLCTGFIFCFDFFFFLSGLFTGRFSRFVSVSGRPDPTQPVSFDKLLTRPVKFRAPPDPTRLDPRQFEVFLIRPAGRAMTREMPFFFRPGPTGERGPS